MRPPEACSPKPAGDGEGQRGGAYGSDRFETAIAAAAIKMLSNLAESAGVRIALARFTIGCLLMAVQSVTFGIGASDVVGLTEAQRTAEEFTAVLSIVSEGTLVYKNLTYPRYQNFYGRCQVMHGAYVVQNVQLQHLNQELLHWRNKELGILETIGCYFKAYGSADTPPISITTNTFLTRVHFTSLRFRLPQNALANLTLQWDVFEAKCGGNILPPAPGQGNPPAPANSGYNPGNRPQAQAGDPFDNSPNDGAPVPPDSDAPPSPGGPAANATWKVTVAGLGNPPGCEPISGTYNSQVGDPLANFSATVIGDPQGGMGCGLPVRQLSASVNGVHLASSDAVRSPGMEIVNIGFY